ncbi:MAG TPA: PPK2 family polyphosphate kinase [Saprospiraceae bacterium]|nr:PPK2 family polyphosphate kinase [Saprospiraceae bacterium]
MIKLSEIPTRAPKGFTKEDIKRKTERMARRIGDLQHIMFAEKKHSILVVLQGMDASGKDGATRKVFEFCNPTGIDAYPFRKPTEEEFAHDFLWRIHRRAPAKGMIQIFIRSHYEDVLIQRVHKWIDEERVTARIKSINDWETLLQYDNNTTILKFYMHLSREQQKKKLQERIDDPRKNWKHNDADWKEAERWDEYIAAYEDAINRSTIPWIIAPVDQRWYRDYFIAEQVLLKMESLQFVLPTLDSKEEE